MAASTINFNVFLEKEKLKNNGSNFADWFRNLRIVLNAGNLTYVLDAPLGDPPAANATDEVKKCLPHSEESVLHSSVCHPIWFRNGASEALWAPRPVRIIKELKLIFETHAAVESYEASEKIFTCKMEEGSSVSEHVLTKTMWGILFWVGVHLV